MILLAIDTSTRYAAVGLADEAQFLSEMCWRSNRNHGAELMPAAMHLLDRAGLTMQEVTHLAVALGPGGYSALRVGIGTVKGLALPRRLPVVGVSTLDLEAAPYGSVRAPVFALLPAGRSEVSWAMYEGGVRKDSGLSTPESLIQGKPDGALFCGEGAATIAALAGEAAILGGPPPTRRPGVLAHIARERFDHGDADDLATLEPIYARAPSVTKPRPPR